MTDDIIKVGNHVRSYDFPDLDGMKTTCYVEGTVEAIGQVPEVGGCDRYTIRITRRGERHRRRRAGWRDADRRQTLPQ